MESSYTPPPLERDEPPQNKETDDPPSADTKEDWALSLAEAAEYLFSYLSARWEIAQLSAKEIAVKVGIALVVIFSGIGFLILAAAFLFYGAALGLGEAMGNRPWLGFIASGLLLASLVLFPLRLAVFGSRKRALKKRWKSYERELEKQSERYGRNAAQAACRN